MITDNSNDVDLSATVMAIKNFADANYRQLPIEEAVALMKSELEASNQSLSSKDECCHVNAVLSIKNNKAHGVEATIQWLRNTGEFSEKELLRINQLQLIVPSVNGQVRFNRHTISMESAMIMLGFISILFGVCAGWLIFADRIGIEQIVQSIGIGMALGSLTNIVLNKSFRFNQLKIRVTQLAPWLDISTP